MQEEDRLLLTTSQAGELLGISSAVVAYRLSIGQIIGHRTRGKWRIHIDDLPTPEPRDRAPRPIVCCSKDGWLPGSVPCGDRAPRRERPPEPPEEPAPWRIVRQGNRTQ